MWLKFVLNLDETSPLPPTHLDMEIKLRETVKLWIFLCWFFSPYHYSGFEISFGCLATPCKVDKECVCVCCSSACQHTYITRHSCSCLTHLSSQTAAPERNSATGFIQLKNVQKPEKRSSDWSHHQHQQQKQQHQQHQQHRRQQKHQRQQKRQQQQKRQR